MLLIGVEGLGMSEGFGIRVMLEALPRVTWTLQKG